VPSAGLGYFGTTGSSTGGFWTTDARADRRRQHPDSWNHDGNDKRQRRILPDQQSPAGLYDLRFSILGTRRSFSRREDTPDLRTRLDVQLESSAIELAPVEVRARQPLIQKDQAATAYSFESKELENFPSPAFQEIVALQPGTTAEGNVAAVAPRKWSTC